MWRPEFFNSGVVEPRASPQSRRKRALFRLGFGRQNGIKMRFLGIVIFSAVVLAWPAMRPACAAEDQVIHVPANDTEMSDAIDKARSTLPQFWARYAKPGPGERNFSLKVRVIDNDRIEHFWVSRIEHKGEMLYGTIDNEPKIVGTVKLGERISFKDDMISDWMFMRNGKLVGNETMRPLLKRMPKEQADRYRAMYETP
jgi:uncharacterized protein YegJ (DUF2314 family)